MYVKNVGGYHFAFRYRDAVIYIPYDGKIYSIPDDSGEYRELKVIRGTHVRTQTVVYINKDGSEASPNICGHKRRGRPSDAEIAKRREEKAKKRKSKDGDNNFVVDVDLDAESTEQTKQRRPARRYKARARKPKQPKE